MLKFAIGLSAIILSALTSWVILRGFPAMGWVCVMATMFVISKLLLTNMMPMGHGVTGTRHILGLPIFNFVAYLIILVLILALASPVASFSPETNANLKALGFALFFGWAAGLIDWYAESARLTHYFSDYGFRLALKQKGYSGEVINSEVDKLRAEGFLPPLSEEEQLERRKRT